MIEMYKCTTDVNDDFCLKHKTKVLKYDNIRFVMTSDGLAIYNPDGYVVEEVLYRVIIITDIESELMDTRFSTDDIADLRVIVSIIKTVLEEINETV